MTFRTTKPADGVVECSRSAATLTFDAQGTPSSSNPQRVDITGGTFQIGDMKDGQMLYSGNITNGRFSNAGEGAGNIIVYANVNHVSSGTYPCASTGETLTIDTPCSVSNENPIDVGILGLGLDGFGSFTGAVDCSSQSGGDTATTTQQSSSTTGTTTTTTTTITTTQDRDRDGISDANDNCPNLPNTRCYKEGDTALVVHNGNR